MYPKLTYILISIALLVSSCSSDTIDDISLPRGGELSFNVSALTRGSVTTSMSQFTVYGDIKPQSSGISIPVILFNKTNVEYKNGSWSYDGTQYWIPKYEHSFVAVSPGAVLETGNAPRYLNSELSFEYSIPAPGGILSGTGDVTDILVATHRRLYKNTGTESSADDLITLKFSHLLSLINFAPALYDNRMERDGYIKIHMIELSGIKTRARFSILPAPMLSGNNTDDMTVDINALAEGNVAIEFSTPVEIKNDMNNVSLFASDNAIIMVPQVFTVDSDARITFSYTINGDSAMKQVSLNLNNLRWESGNSYLYRFTIERTGIKFDNCEITPWNIIKGEEITVD